MIEYIKNLYDKRTDDMTNSEFFMFVLTMILFMCSGIAIVFGTGVLIVLFCAHIAAYSHVLAVAIGVVCFALLIAVCAMLIRLIP